jgi:hypothetical protein
MEPATGPYLSQTDRVHTLKACWFMRVAYLVWNLSSESSLLWGEAAGALSWSVSSTEVCSVWISASIPPIPNGVVLRHRGITTVT